MFPDIIKNIIRIRLPYSGGMSEPYFTDAKQTPIVENIVNHLKKNDMNSSALKIISQHTNTPLKTDRKSCIRVFSDGHMLFAFTA